PVLTDAIWFFVDPGRDRRLLTSATTTPSKSTSCSRTRSTSLPASVSRSARVATSTWTSTYSLSQLREISMDSELPQKAHVVLEEQAEVGDVVLEHRQPVQPGTEGKAGIVFRVDAAIAEHLRMHHPGPKDLEPAALAAAAARPITNATGHRPPNARFREGEVIADDTDAPVGAEQRTGEIFDRSL